MLDPQKIEQEKLQIINKQKSRNSPKIEIFN